MLMYITTYVCIDKTNGQAISALNLLSFILSLQTIHTFTSDELHVMINLLHNIVVGII